MNVVMAKNLVIGAARSWSVPALRIAPLPKARADTRFLAISWGWRSKTHIVAHSIPKTQFPPVIEVGVLLEGFGRGAKRRRKRQAAPDKASLRHVDLLTR